MGPLVKQVLDNKDLHINTNPVEIYKQWINGKELETGKYFLKFREYLILPKRVNEFILVCEIDRRTNLFQK